MNIRSLLPWLLAGGLAASTLWNLHLVRRLDDMEARLAPRAEPVVLPGRVVTALGLTKQQCEMIRGCSMT